MSNQVITEFAVFFEEQLKLSEDKLKDMLPQLWFDVKFLLKMFSDRNQSSETTENLILEILSRLYESQSKFSEFSDSLKDTLGWITRVDDLDKRIRGLMDPVDLLFYEKRIQQQTLLFFKSCHVLFGVICSGANTSDIES